MWCAHCDTEVATEIAADGQSLLCINCGREVRRLYTPSLHPDVRRARDAVSRLSAGSQTDHVGPPAEPESSNEPAAASQEKAKPQLRIDRAHPAGELARSHLGGLEEPAPTRQPGIDHRSDAAHAAVPAPHFRVAARRAPRPPGRGESTWGQLLAYAGVLVLTIGTTLVVWGYLGGPPTYAPTGWLVATAGQMLLLLGVVTLVAGGVQQTTHEVSARVANLSGRMVRIEQTANELLRGPHFGSGQRSATVPPKADEAAEGTA